MVREEVLQTFRDYIGIKLHFTSKVDWTPTLGRKISEDALLKRKDFSFFQKAAQMFPNRSDRIQFFVSCFKGDPNSWIGEILSRDHLNQHKKRMGKISRLRQIFSDEVDNIVDFMLEFNVSLKGMLKVYKTAPYIIEQETQILGGVSEETLSLIDRATKFSNQETDCPLWKSRSFEIAKYSCFLTIVSDSDIDKQLKKMASVVGEMPERAPQLKLNGEIKNVFREIEKKSKQSSRCTKVTDGRREGPVRGQPLLEA